MTERAGDDGGAMTMDRAGAYVAGREDLSEFHYNFEDIGNRHGDAWSDSLAWTHCICFGASARAVAPLLDEVRRLQRVVATMVETIDDDGVVTTPGGDRFAFLTDATDSVRRAVEVFAEERENDRA